MNNKIILLTPLLLAVSPLFAEHGRTELDDITVTAEKREGQARDIPASINILPDVLLEDAGVVDTESLIRQVPNMHMIDAGNHSTAGFFSIRGITPVMEGEPTVGFFIDDVYHSIFDVQLFDVERVEVLKGPQGTLYGRNSLAGVVNIVTKGPTETWRGDARLGYAKFGSFTVSGAISGPLVKDKLLMRIAAQKYTSDAAFENEFNSNNAADKRDEFNIRAKLKWLPARDLQVELVADNQLGRNGNASFAPIDQLRSNPHKVNLDHEGFADFNSDAGKLKVVYDASGFKLTSITGYTNEQDKASIDLDFGPLDLMRLDTNIEISRISQELRMASQVGSAFEWLTGLYFFDEDNTSSFFVDLRQGVADFGLPPFRDITDSDTESRGYAVFGQADYLINDRFKLTFGLRYDKESKDFNISQSTDPLLQPTISLKDDEDFDAWLPKLALTYFLRPRAMVYATVARGYKSGGFNRLARIDNTNIKIAFNPEFTWNYEMGIKSIWLDERLDLTAAIFHIDWTDQQIEQQLYPHSVTTNAAESTSQGFELELAVIPTFGLRFTAGVGYTDAKFDQYTDKIFDPTTGAVISQVDYIGKRIPTVPRLTYNLGAEYAFASDWFARIGLRGTGNYFHDVQNTLKENDYRVVNSRIGYETERLQISLWAKNLLDEEYAVRSFEFPGIGAVGRAGDPRTLGLTLKTSF